MLLVLNGLENTLVVNKFPSAEFTKYSIIVLHNSEYCFISSTEIHYF